jgi:hypothetical protein
VAVRDLREWWPAANEEELGDYETDLLAGFVLARASSPNASAATGSCTKPSRSGQTRCTCRWCSTGAVALCEAGAGVIVDPGWSDRQGQLGEGSHDP